MAPIQIDLFIPQAHTLFEVAHLCFIIPPFLRSITDAKLSLPVSLLPSLQQLYFFKAPLMTSKTRKTICLLATYSFDPPTPVASEQLCRLPCRPGRGCRVVTAELNRRELRGGILHQDGAGARRVALGHRKQQGAAAIPGTAGAEGRCGIPGTQWLWPQNGMLLANSGTVGRVP